MRTPSFQPHPLVPGGQLQTLAGQFLPESARRTTPRDELVELPDGDKLLLHVDTPARDAGEKPLVLLMHGLGGCSESSYLVRLAVKLTDLGLTVLRFNHRGCGRGAAGLAREIYHAGRTEDLAATLAHVERRWPGRAYCVAAFSLSGNLLLRFLGETAAQSPRPLLRRALAVCPPVDLEACSVALDSWRNWHIDKFYTRLLVQTAHAKSAQFPELPPAVFPRRLTLRRFDEVYTAPRAGFASRDAYYERASAKPHVGDIAVPTTLLAAEDDPIIPPASFAGARFSPAVQLRIERSGGHMGFIAARKTRFGDRRWMDAFVADWAEGV